MKNINIIRKIKLSKLGCYQIKDCEKELFYFIEKNIIGLKIVKNKEYFNCIDLLNNNDKWIFMLDLNNNGYDFNYLHSNYELVWEPFHIKFEYSYMDTHHIIKELIEDAYKFKNIFAVIPNESYKYDKI